MASARADAVVSAAFAKGQIFDWSKSARDPELLTKSDCPALIIGPSRSPRRPATNVSDDVAVEIDITIVSDLRDAADIDDLFAAVEAWVKAWGPAFGLAEPAAPHTAEIKPAEFAPFDAKTRERGIEWKCDTGIVATIRRTR